MEWFTIFVAISTPDRLRFFHSTRQEWKDTQHSWSFRTVVESRVEGSIARDQHVHFVSPIKFVQGCLCSTRTIDAGPLCLVEHGESVI